MFNFRKFFRPSERTFHFEYISDHFFFMIIRKIEGAIFSNNTFNRPKRAIMSHQPAGRPVIGTKCMPLLDIFSIATYASPLSIPSVVIVSSISLKKPLLRLMELEISFMISIIFLKG